MDNQPMIARWEEDRDIMIVDGVAAVFDKGKVVDVSKKVKSSRQIVRRQQSIQM